MLTVGFVLTILLCFIGLYYWFIQRRFQYWKKRKIPYLKPDSLIFGNYKNVVLGRITSAEFFRYAYNEAAPHKLSGLFSFFNPVLLVRDPEIIKNILTSDFDHFSDRSPNLVNPKIALTRHLYNLCGEEWKTMRNALMPAFSAMKTKSTFGFVKAYADELVNTVGQSIDKTNGCVEMGDIIERYCVDVITQFIYGIRANALKDPESEFRQIGKQQHQGRSIFISVIKEVWPKLIRMLNITFISPKVQNFFRSITWDTMNRRSVINDAQQADLMNFFMNLRMKDSSSSGIKNLDTDLVAAQCFITFMAGYKPTSLLLNFMLMELAKSEFIQQKIQMEIDSVLENYDNQITTESLYDMTYIDQIISETVRMYPVSPVLMRTCTKEYHVPRTEFIIDKGTLILIPLHGLHNDPKYFSRPKEFNPDHFSNEAKYSRPRFSFIPFGEGSRHCIAWRLALLMVKLVIVTMMQHYNLRPSSKMPSTVKYAKYTTIIKLEHGIWLECIRKETASSE